MQLSCLAVLIFGLLWAVDANAAPTLVRHAGGEIRGVRYSNSLEAIRSSIDLGSSLIEIDLVPSREGRWYCLHDYEEVWPPDTWRVRTDRWVQRWLARMPPSTYPGDWAYPPSADLERHLAAHDARSGLQHCRLDDLLRIAKEHPGRLAFITDTKYDNYRLLDQLAKLDKQALVPQVYNIEEYLAARRLGLPRIIFTLYKHGDYEQLRAILHDAMLWKVVFPAAWLCESAPARAPAWLNGFGGEILVHTVNDPKELCPSPVRVDGYYTDALAPAQPRTVPTPHEH